MKKTHLIIAQTVEQCMGYFARLNLGEHCISVTSAAQLAGIHPDRILRVHYTQSGLLLPDVVDIHLWVCRQGLLPRVQHKDDVSAQLFILLQADRATLAKEYTRRYDDLVRSHDKQLSVQNSLLQAEEARKTKLFDALQLVAKQKAAILVQVEALKQQLQLL